MKSHEYHTEVVDVALTLFSEALEYTDNNDDAKEQAYERLHEELGQHQYIIYYHYNIDVLKHSANDNALYDQGLEDTLGGVDSLHGVLQRFAYWAMNVDVSSIMQDLDNELDDCGTEYDDLGEGDALVALRELFGGDKTHENELRAMYLSRLHLLCEVYYSDHVNTWK